MGLELFKTPLMADANLKAYYRMESGALTTDASGQGNTLTNNNSVGEEASGQFGGCADFGATDGNKTLSIAESLGYVNGSPYSISLWIKLRAELSGGDTYTSIVSVAETTTDTFLAIMYNRISSVNQVYVQLYKQAVGTGGNKTVNINLGTSVWHHIVLVSSGTTIRVYIDGVDSGTAAISGNGASNIANIMALGGNPTDLTSQNIAAYLDDVSFFNRVLTAAEVLSIYQGDGWAASTGTLTNYRPRKRTTGAVSV